MQDLENKKIDNFMANVLHSLLIEISQPFSQVRITFTLSMHNYITAV